MAVLLCLAQQLPEWRHSLLYRCCHMQFNGGVTDVA